MGVQLYAANGYNSTQVLPMRPARVVMMGSAVLRVLHRFTYVFRFLLALVYFWYMVHLSHAAMEHGLRERALSGSHSAPRMPGRGGCRLHYRTPYALVPVARGAGVGKGGRLRVSRASRWQPRPI